MIASPARIWSRSIRFSQYRPGFYVRCHPISFTFIGIPVTIFFPITYDRHSVFRQDRKIFRLLLSDKVIFCDPLPLTRWATKENFKTAMRNAKNASFPAERSAEMRGKSVSIFTHRLLGALPEARLRRTSPGMTRAVRFSRLSRMWPSPQRSVQHRLQPVPMTVFL